MLACCVPQCAQWLLKQETEQLSRLLDERPGWRLKVVGHSLGAGTAALLCIMAHSDEEVNKRVQGCRYYRNVSSKRIFAEIVAFTCAEGEAKGNSALSSPLIAL